jgi:hypothetical protein
MRPALGLAFLTAAASAVVDDEPRLVLDAPRVQMLLPGLAAKGYGKRVEVTARLEGDAEDPETYYCLDEIWDWGDGTESVHENDCDPYEEGKEILTSFSDTHHYRPGEYEITLRLVRRDQTVVKGVIDVRIR